MGCNNNYIVIQESSLNVLEEEVSRMKSKGWKTTGGVCVVCFKDDYSRNIGKREYRYYQAMEKN